MKRKFDFNKTLGELTVRQFISVVDALFDDRAALEKEKAPVDQIDLDGRLSDLTVAGVITLLATDVRS
jgi:hypothetical protein